MVETTVKTHENAKTRYDKRKPPLGVRVTPDRRERLEELAKQTNRSASFLIGSWIVQAIREMNDRNLAARTEGFETGRQNATKTKPRDAIVFCARCGRAMYVQKSDEQLLRVTIGTRLRHLDCPKDAWSRRA